jgi:hypothetical protein
MSSESVLVRDLTLFTCKHWGFLSKIDLSDAFPSKKRSKPFFIVSEQHSWVKIIKNLNCQI